AFRCRIVSMPGAWDKSPDSRALEMRLSVPPEGGLRGIASELATKIAEHLGARSPDAQSLGAMVDGLASRLGNGGAQQQDITFEFRQVDGELVIEARCDGKASEVRHPLPA
ncbi:MAG: hypothetical protein ACRD15_03085, partial [Vicinamibacterales bacterium]